MKHAKETALSQKRSVPRLVFDWALVILWASFIFYMSSRTGNHLGTGFFSQVGTFLKNSINSVVGYHDDSASVFCHFVEYLILGVLLSRAMGARRKRFKLAILAIVIASCYGISDEFHQIFVDGRVCDPKDWLVDTLGASLGAIVSTLLRR